MKCCWHMKINRVHLHSHIAILAKSLKKTCFTPKQNEMYPITTVGKVIYNGMFPHDFPYLNEVSTENFKATPDKYFVPMGTDVKEALKDIEMWQPSKRRIWEKLIGEVFKRYDVDTTSEISDEIKKYGIQIFYRCRHYGIVSRYRSSTEQGGICRTRQNKTPQN